LGDGFGGTPMSEVPVSVVVPAYNAERTLGACLEALTRQVRPADEVVVVDNGSTDGTAAVAHRFSGRLPGLRVVVEPRAGEAAARNRGLEEARGDVIAFTDADCVPREDWLDQAVRTLGAWPECAAVAGEVAGYRPGRLVEKYLSVAAFPTPTGPCVVEGLRFPPPTFYTANFVVRRAALARVGPFDESLTVGLDVDLCVRLLRAGFRIGYQPGAVVAHVQRDSLRKMMRRLFQYGTGVPAWFRKYAEAGVWLTLPGRRAVCVSWMPWRGWVNLSTPDRLVFALGLATVAEPWLGVVLLAYLGRLGWKLVGVARRREVALAPWELPVVLLLHVAEFTVFTAGSISGSLRQRVLCVV